MSFSDEPSSASLHSTRQSTTDSAHGRGRKGLRMDVFPGKSLGPFKLGTPLHHIIALVQGEASGLPPTTSWAVGTLPNNSVRIFLDEWGIVLTFHPKTQRLAMAEICNLGTVELSHAQGLLCGAGATPTFVRLYDVLGPTFAGEMDAESGEYVLSYAGLDVVFKIPAEFRDLYAGDKHPITLPDNTTPVALALIVREETNDSLVAPSLAPFAQPWADVRVKWGTGISFVPSEPQASAYSPLSVDFGASPQDVIAALGPPESHIVKGDERVRVQGGADDALAAPSLYGLGYPSYGIDFLFSGADDALVKIVLFAGIQNHDSFLRYNRCFFQVPFETEHSGALWLGKAESAASGDFPSQCVTPYTKWSQVKKWIQSEGCGDLPRPLLATAAEGTLNLWAMSGIAFAVAQEDDAIAVVTLTRPAGVGLRRAVNDGSAPAPLLAFRTPFGSSRPSPAAGPAPPPMRAAVSGEFDDCQDDIDGYFTKPDPEDPNHAAAAAAAAEQAHMPGPTVLRTAPEAIGSPTQYRFAYPGFDDGGAAHDATPESLPPPLSAMVSAPLGTGSTAEDPDAESSTMPPAGAATMTFGSDGSGCVTGSTHAWAESAAPDLQHQHQHQGGLPAEVHGNNDEAQGDDEDATAHGSAARNTHNAHVDPGVGVDTDYADDAFESLPTTEQQLRRDPAEEAMDGPEEVEGAAVVEEDEEVQPNPHHEGEGENNQETAEEPLGEVGQEDDVGFDVGAAEEEDAQGADVAPPTAPPAHAGKQPFSYAAAIASRTPTASEPVSPQGDDEGAAVAAAAEEDTEGASINDTSNQSPQSGFESSPPMTSRSCSPALADDDMTPPVTPPAGGQDLPKPGAKVVAPTKKGKKKKGRR